MPDDAGLEVVCVTVRFGGATVLSDVSLTGAAGRVTGLIGPNGAGKTTLFNVCSGLLQPVEGVVRLAGQDVTRLPPQQRARLGLGRTFQRLELFDSLSVERNVALGREALVAGGSPWRHLVCSRADRRVVAAATEEAIELCGLGPVAQEPAGRLSTGRRRLVELARAAAGGFRFLLLDEPSSGLDHDETAAFGEILRHLVSSRGVGILLVEHDMALVVGVCDHVYVLDFGAVVFEGSPAEMQASPVVRDAYLGTAV